MQANLVCLDCKHYLGYLKCPAFNDLIPDIIVSGESDHTEPLPDQGNDIVFEPID